MMTATDSDTVCPVCEESFERKTAMYSHHRHKHGGELGGVDVTCDACGKEMTRSPSLAESGEMNVCSKECEDRVRGRGERREYECEYCDEVFKRLKSKVDGDIVFCDEDCHFEWLSEEHTGERHRMYGTGEAFYRDCKQCGEEMRLTNNAPAQKFCEDDCYAEWMSENKTGQDHPNWRGGVGLADSLRKLLSPSWRSINDQVRENECEMCGEVGDGHHVHHIIPVKAGGTNEPWNLMTLCAACHAAVEAHTYELPGIEPFLLQ